MTTADIRAAQAQLTEAQHALNALYREEHEAHKNGERPWFSEAWDTFRDTHIQPARDLVETRKAAVITAIMFDR